MADHIHTTKHDYYERQKSGMKLERSSWDSHVKLIAENIHPRRTRFFMGAQNKGTRRHNNIINSHGTQAKTTATAGLFAGIMRPTSPWFDLGVADLDMMKFQPVKVWFEQLATQMRAIFNASNLYNMAPVMLGESLTFGTGFMTHVDDDENLARFYTHTFGSYYIAQNEKFKVDSFCREYMMQAGQMAKEFGGASGVENLSVQATNAVKNNNLHAWFPVVHFVEPNDNFRKNSFLSKDKKFSSVKYEPGSGDRDKLLSEKGFDEFPGYALRWATTGEDIYGSDCPGMNTLGDIKQLQIMTKRHAQAIDKMVNPPLTGPASVRNVPVSSLPGGLTLYDGDSSRNKLESLYNVNINLADLERNIDKVERRIDTAWYVDLFLAITNMEGIQPRNQLELSERNAERLLQLGPVLESTQGDFLDPLISRTFNQMVRAGIVPPAPEEIQASPIKIEYISSLAQAQRAVDTRSIDRLAEFTGGLVSAGLADGKAFDGDEAIRKYGDFLGTPPKILVPSADVDKMRQAEQEQQQQQQQLEMAEALARAGRDAGTGAAAGVQAAVQAAEGPQR